MTRPVAAPDIQPGMVISEINGQATFETAVASVRQWRSPMDGSRLFDIYRVCDGRLEMTLHAGDVVTVVDP